MARVVLVELVPWDPATGQPVALKLAGGGRRHYTHRGSTEWIGGVVTLPKVTTELPFSGTDFTGGAIPKAAAIGFNPSRAGARDQIAGLMMIGAPVTVRIDNDDVADPVWPVTLAGTVADCSTSGGTLTITLSDLTGNLAKPLVTATFAGTGGLEGPDEATGRVKRRSWGRCWNVEGRVLDKGNNVYEFGDPAFPLLAIDVVKDRGRAGVVQQLGWQGSAAATLAALAATAVPDGGAVVAPSIACAKWFTAPSAPITADLRGEVGSGYVETVPAIAARIVAAAHGPAIGNLDAAIASRPDEAGWHVDNTNDTAATVLNGLLLKASLAWSIEASGTMTLSPIAFDAPVATLVASSVARQQSYPPVTSIEVGFRTNHRQHTDAEISAAVLSDVIQLTGDSPIETAIGDAGKTATEIVAPGAVIGGTKNADGSIAGGAPAATFVDAMAELAKSPDPAQWIANARALVDRARQVQLTQIADQLLAQARKSRADSLTHLDGIPIGARVRTEITERQEQGSALAQQIVETEAAITGPNGPIAAAVTQLTQALADSDHAQALALQALDAEITGPNGPIAAAVTQLTQAVADANSARAEAFEQLQAAITANGNELDAAFTQLSQAVVTETGARVQADTDLKAQITGPDGPIAAAVSQLNLALTNQQSATAQMITDLSASITGPQGALTAAVTTLTQAIADETGARATQVTQLSSTVAGNTASVELLFQTINGEQAIAQLAVTVQDDGVAKITGLKIEGQDRRILFAADNVIIGDSDIFDVDTVAKTVTIKNAIIGYAAINSGNIAGSAVQQSIYAPLQSDVACGYNAITTVVSKAFTKHEADSTLKVQFWGNFWSGDDLQFDASFVVDATSYTAGNQNIVLDSLHSAGKMSITPFIYLEGIPAGSHTIQFAVFNREPDDGPLYVKAGSALEIAELKKAAV